MPWTQTSAISLAWELGIQGDKLEQATTATTRLTISNVMKERGAFPPQSEICVRIGAQPAFFKRFWKWIGLKALFRGSHLKTEKRRRRRNDHE
jgi:hypothetical protein